jgi:hypothetical protein
MLRQGPIPVTLHGIIEYLAAVLCIAAPFVFSFDSDSATAAAIVIGVVVLAVAATTSGPTSLVDSLPVLVHVVLDFILAGVLIAAPFVFDFREDGTATAFFIVLGVAHLLITIGTRFDKRRTQTARA